MHYVILQQHSALIYYFLGVYPEYRDGISKEKWLRLSVLLAVTTMLKPNFLISFCSAFGVVLLRDLFKERIKEEFTRVFQFGSIIVPSLTVLGVQYWLIYASDLGDTSSRIQLVLFSDLLWEGSILHMLFKLGRDLAFPLLGWIVVAFTERYMKNKSLSAGNDIKNIRFLMLMYLLSLAMFSLFKESGHRGAHGNFGWGVLMSYFIMFLYLVPAFIKSSMIYRKKNLTGRRQTVMIRLACAQGITLLILHFASGIIYFLWIASGRIYWR